jgi:glycosyltransferase involved in cell wall biosynthesis
MNVAICHQGFAEGDAISNDMAGMYRLLEAFGMQVTVLCEWNSRSDKFRVADVQSADWSSFDLIIYHHSLYWERGDQILDEAVCPLVFKYHNITPPLFFQPYSDKYAGVCRQGREQTIRFVRSTKQHTWLADSAYNREEIVDGGADPLNVHIVPPFNRIEQLLQAKNIADYNAETVEILFIGRLSPNKGHPHLLHIAKALTSELSGDFIIRIVGGFDPELERYRQMLAQLVKDLDMAKHVEFRQHVSDGELLRLFQRSHVYLSCSQHEGFCVPVIEAQALGLPVVAANIPAVGETAGLDQLLPAPPESASDYSFYAALITELIKNERLRDRVETAGYHNVRTRFASEMVEDAFAGQIYEFLSSA